MVDGNFVYLKNQLEQEKAVLQKLLTKYDSSDKLGDEGFVPPSTHGQDDEAERVADMEIQLKKRGNLKEVLAEVEQALAKIQDGTYGICESCSQPIAPNRLEFLPTAKLCIACQRNQEHN